MTLVVTVNPEVKRKYLEAGVIGRNALELGKSLATPGALLLDVAEKIEGFIREQGAVPSFPVNLSINNEAAPAVSRTRYPPLALCRDR